MMAARRGGAAHVTIIVSGADAEEIARDVWQQIRIAARRRKKAGKEPFGYFLCAEPEIGTEEGTEQSELDPA